MTMRRRVQATVVAAAMLLGAVPFADLASASVSVSPMPAHRVIGPDPLAQTAADALDAWELYNTVGAWTGKPTEVQVAIFADFVRLRDQVAAEAATRLGIDPLRMQAAWIAADRIHQLAVLSAFTQLGVPYGHFARTAGVGFDCSGITSWAWEQAGFEIPRGAKWQIVSATEVTAETAQAGDLIFYPTHVMMYLGVDLAILHSPNRKSTVHLSNVWKRKIPKLQWGNPLG
ncbi:MAG: C40 family peptidase [Actinomycetia bacterium]|nr:C40 family peptidase [Actinomycetes bacterium]